ncbi:MAG: ArdC family protein [Solirubrobacteraceae bacterium]
MKGRKLTDAERAERRQADRERLERAARALLSSDGWHRWVRVRSTNGLSRYSFGNQLLIAMQRPDATYIAGFRAFLELNRCVRKGERAIRILAPMSLRDRDKEAAKRKGGDDREQSKRTVFRAVSVFDVSQTDPLPGKDPVSLESPSQPIQGETHAHLLTQLEQLAAQLGYTVQRRALDGPVDGWCDSAKQEVVINAALAANAQVRVLVHEIAHALGVSYTDYGRRRAEVLVDTVTFIVCGSVGLDTSGSSVPYVAGWGESGELDAIRGYAETIDKIARRIEDSLRSDEAHATADGARLAA